MNTEDNDHSYLEEMESNELWLPILCWAMQKQVYTLQEMQREFNINGIKALKFRNALNEYKLRTRGE